MLPGHPRIRKQGTGTEDEMEGSLAPAPERPQAVVASLSVIANDPRIRRQIVALIGAGWSVTSVGFGTVESGPQWRHIAISELPHDAQPLRRAARIAGLLAIRGRESLALHVWRAQSRHRVLIQALAGLERADLVIANDYTALPASLALARQVRAGLIYDTHEYAAGERDEDLRWRLLYPPYIRALERMAIQAGAIVTTVSAGIAARIAADYAIPTPLVIRNMPSYRRLPERPVGPNALVHYHGVVVPGRGLEILIDSVALWQPRFRLRIRGPASPDYIRTLRQRTEHLGLSDRITFEAAVPAGELIEQAADADIGIHVLPGFSHQNSYALPNKLFEYLMAGLAVVVTDLPEMRQVVIDEGVGKLVQHDTPEAIAVAVNSMTADEIVRCRQAALASARRLCWEREQEIFLEACARASSQAGLAHTA